ncbi:MAG: cyclic-di-AMP receptor [Candidatus Dormibacteraceae bacterium]
MKLVIAVVQGEDAAQTVHALSGAGISVTKLASSGGFLQQGNSTLMIGVDDDKVDAAIEVIRENCRERSRYMTPMPPMVEPGEFFMPYPVEVQVGGATVFVVNVDRFEKL